MSSKPKSIFVPSDGFSCNGTPTGWPFLHYRAALPADAGKIENTFSNNGWEPQWRYAMFKESHYHSTTHEALGVYAGRAKLLIGGERGKGVEVEVEAGDALVLPAGYAHRALEDGGGFSMVGAYPMNRVADWDMQYGRSKEEEEDTTRRIREWSKEAPADPVEGEGDDTTLKRGWKS